VAEENGPAARAAEVPFPFASGRERSTTAMAMTPITNRNPTTPRTRASPRLDPYPVGWRGWGRGRFSRARPASTSDRASLPALASAGINVFQADRERVFSDPDREELRRVDDRPRAGRERVGKGRGADPDDVPIRPRIDQFDRPERRTRRPR